MHSVSTRVLVTGSMGCLGAWTIKHLLEHGHTPVGFDLSGDRRRVEALLPADELEAVRFVRGDLTDQDQVRNVVLDNGCERIIHLAALQVPFCRANPSLGVSVNVQGTVHVFEAAKAAGISHLAYASSIAVYGPDSDYASANGPSGLISNAHAAKRPRTIYGVTKVANEGTAEVYWRDHQLSSVALRPYTVYGVGRDQGVTSEPSQAMAAAARGEDFHISFGGEMQFHFASDVARQFIDAAFARFKDPGASRGARVFDLGGPVVSVADVAALIERARPGVKVTVGDAGLPFPRGFDDADLRGTVEHVYQTPLEDGVRQTIAALQAA